MVVIPDYGLLKKGGMKRTRNDLRLSICRKRKKEKEKRRKKKENPKEGILCNSLSLDGAN